LFHSKFLTKFLPQRTQRKNSFSVFAVNRSADYTAKRLSRQEMRGLGVSKQKVKSKNFEFRKKGGFLHPPVDTLKTRVGDRVNWLKSGYRWLPDGLYTEVKKSCET